ncbi:MAG: hypothetical protein HYZ88_02545 [Candidatus Omnitrophica bacterium]|nr:hypothetical protein [Candidatus Omnitrophota bacterium]
MKWSWVCWLAFSMLWVARSPFFPLFLDPYYHLLVARQLIEAGGPIAYEWWEAAPVGRPHLYPPVLHLLLAGLLRIGCSPIGALQWATIVVMPATFASLCLVMRRLTQPTVAFASLVLAMMPFVWILEVSGRLASGLALIELLWFMMAMAQQRLIAGACLLALLFYTHLGLPWVALASLVGGWWLKGLPRDRRQLMSVGAGLLFALPWLWHLAVHLPLLHTTRRAENQTIEFLPALLLLAVVGAVRCWKAVGAPRLLLGLWLGCCLMAYSFAFRWLSGEGLLPVILLAGYGFEEVSQRMMSVRPRPSAPWVGRLVLAGLVLIAPTVFMDGSTLRVAWFDTAPFHLLNWSQAQQKGIDVRLYGPRSASLARRVMDVSQPGEILWSNMSYGGGLIAALANRATSSTMLHEVAPARAFSAIEAAHLVVWFKVDPLPETPDLGSLIRRDKLQLVVDDSLAWVFRNPTATQLAHRPEAVIPLWLAFVLLCGVLGLTVWDFQRNFAKQNFSRVVTPHKFAEHIDAERNFH